MCKETGFGPNELVRVTDVEVEVVDDRWLCRMLAGGDLVGSFALDCVAECDLAQAVSSAAATLATHSILVEWPWLRGSDARSAHSPRTLV